MGDMTAIDPSVIIDELRAEIQSLSERLARLEAGLPVKSVVAAAPPEPVPPSSAPEQAPEGIPEEILMVISAAVAAFLGERAHIRQVRLIRSPAWAQQGRVTIQASHQLQH